ncbi:hypothetical protein [Mucilaginibacter panaciglaebae]|uniref:Tail length tape measure protein n=1 Tax=Mucilaginibacter panaciglaebae TaxID=502331 RepID=A0ABP7WP03_9SPHI
MANPTKNNVSIEVEINAAGQQQLDKYSTAFDGLRDSISNLSNPISKLDGDINKLNDTVKELQTQNNSTADSIIKVKETYSALTYIIDGLKKGFELAKAGTLSFEAALTGGLSVIIAFLPEIIKWIGELSKGETSLSALNKTLKDTKIVVDAVNDARLKGTQNAQQELVHLKLLYNATKDKNISDNERQKILSQLQAQYPGYFDKMTTEKMLNNEAAYSYNNLTESILANSRARAAENVMVKNQERSLGNDNNITKLKAQLAEYNKQLTAAKKAEHSLVHGFTGVPGIYNVDTDTQALVGQRSNLEKQRDATQKLIDDLYTDTSLLNRQNQALAKTINDNTKKYGAKTLGISNPTTYHISSDEGSSTSKPQKAIQAQAEHFAQRIETTKKQYEIEQANFDKQLDAQLISQEDHNELSKQVQEKFMADMRKNIGAFNHDSSAEILQYQKELVEAQKIGEDQDAENKAILPAQKLAAEKQLIEDKYNFEIQKANEAGKDTAVIRMRYAQEIAEADKKFAQERKDFELQTTQEVSNAAFSILQNSIKSQSEAKLKQLETQKASELNNSSLTGAQKKAIEDKYTKKEAGEKTKAFKAEQRASLLQAVINGALAITKVTSQSGILAPFVIPGIIAETAIQVATITAQKAPQYAKGGVHYQSDGRGALLPGYSRTDNMNAYLRSGEAVVVSEAMRDPWARNLVSAINVAYGGRDFSMANPQRGYAIGGIFTDGGNSNRYYNQPMNDQKDLANTIAYQMINNFPPVYVDVKDINTQQSILAQTINRVNL